MCRRLHLPRPDSGWSHCRLHFISSDTSSDIAIATPPYTPPRRCRCSSGAEKRWRYTMPAVWTPRSPPSPPPVPCVTPAAKPSAPSIYCGFRCENARRHIHSEHDDDSNARWLFQRPAACCMLQKLWHMSEQAGRLHQGRGILYGYVP